MAHPKSGNVTCRGLGILYRPHYWPHRLFVNIHPVVVIVGLIFGNGKLFVVRKSSRSGLLRMRLWWLTWVGTLSLSGIGHLASDVAVKNRWPCSRTLHVRQQGHLPYLPPCHPTADLGKRARVLVDENPSTRVQQRCPRPP